MKKYKVTISYWKGFQLGEYIQTDNLSQEFIDELIEGGIAEEVLEQENLVVNKILSETNRPKGFLILIDSNNIPHVAIYNLNEENKYQYRGIVLDYEVVKTDNRFKPFDNEEQLNVMLENIRHKYNVASTFLNKDEKRFSLQDLQTLLYKNPANNHSPFATELNSGIMILATTHLLLQK